MNPSPGRIHQLPVKVLYSLEGGDQSYLTVLSETQDVYVHPGNPRYGSDDEPGPVGSTYLKAIAQGVCYASPECVPSTSSLDFSVYNLDTSARIRPASSSHPFASSSTSMSTTTADESTWSGKGFLSWAMAEQGPGSTLVKGRLTKEYDFEASRFSQEGGLEALMRAAAANGGAAGGGGDGRGWGLEVVISLKMVNPAGKGEFSGRREFERMLFSGNGQASGSVLVSSPSRPTFRPAPHSALSTISNPNANTAHHSSPRLPLSDTGRPGTTPPVSHAPTPPTARPALPASRSSISSFPPSSVPMAGTSSQSGPSRPPSASTSTSVRPPYRPPPPPPPVAGPPPATSTNANAIASGSASTQNGRANSQNPASSSTSSAHRPSGSSSHTTPNKQTAAGRPPSRHSRQVTPPPLPRPRSPPPTTPHRRALRDLLQADGKMSPSLAKDLMSNPALLALVRSIPSSALPGRSDSHSHLQQQQQQQQSRSGSAARSGSKAVKAEDSRSVRDETPTPTGPKTATTSVAAAAPAPADGNIPGGCSNCGTTETTLWRSKVYPDGTQTKVCDECGLYFNKHKRMRPKELWDPHSHSASSKRAKVNENGNGNGNGTSNRSSAQLTSPPSIPSGVRHSPRLNKHQNGPHGSPGSGNGNGGSNMGHGAPPLPAMQDSPSKRRRTSKAVPQPSPSPRMATRSSARTESGNKVEPFPFTPTPGSNPGHHHQHQQQQQQEPQQETETETERETGGIGDIDIDALLAQLANGQADGEDGLNAGQAGGNGHENADGTGAVGGGFNLGDLFASVDNAAATDDALAEDMMKFLAGLEDHGDAGDGDGDGGGSAQDKQQQS